MSGNLGSTAFHLAASSSSRENDVLIAVPMTGVSPPILTPRFSSSDPTPQQSAVSTAQPSALIAWHSFLLMFPANDSVHAAGAINVGSSIGAAVRSRATPGLNFRYAPSSLRDVKALLVIGFPVAYRATDLLRGTPSGLEFRHRVFGG